MRGRRNPFTGEQSIIHSSPKNGAVAYGSEWEFAQGRAIRAKLVPLTPQGGEIGLQRMESIQGLAWTMPSSNCQHTTNWAALGIARSEQYEAFVGALLFGAALYALSRKN
jgi:hypothetical protein